MALVLVVVDAFGPYLRGDQITDETKIAQVRTSEYAGQVVMVSDTLIPPPVPPATPNYDEVVAAYRLLVAQIAEQQEALDEAVALNGTQSVLIGGQALQIDRLTSSVAYLTAKIDNPSGGTPVPPNLADDKPLAEVDGVVLATNGGRVLVGDIR